MMNWRHISVNLLMLSLSFSGSQAMADDTLLDAPEVTISAAETAAQRFYLRGDLGYSGWADEGNPSFDVFNPATGTTNGHAFDATRFGNPLSGSLGVGYQISDMVRTDVTVDYFEGRFDADSFTAEPCAGALPPTGCRYETTARFSALGIMANGYVDLGTLAGFTPYLGAGLGVTHLRWNDISQAECAALPAGCVGAESRTSPGGESSWRFTYALMAGASYDLTDRLKFDVGYRYSQIGKGDMFGGSTFQAKDDGLSRHEIRAGLRLSLW